MHPGNWWGIDSTWGICQRTSNLRVIKTIFYFRFYSDECTHVLLKATIAIMLMLLKLFGGRTRLLDEWYLTIHWEDLDYEWLTTFFKLDCVCWQHSSSSIVYDWQHSSSSIVWQPWNLISMWWISSCSSNIIIQVRWVGVFFFSNICVFFHFYYSPLPQAISVNYYDWRGYSQSSS